MSAAIILFASFVFLFFARDGVFGWRVLNFTGITG